MLGRIAIRNIPTEIWDGLEVLAARHDRSTEAEARHALRSWVEPQLQRNERSARRMEVSARLSALLEQVNRVGGFGKIKPSHIAQAIGEDRAESTEQWFTGESEPMFSQLEAISHYLGGRKEWLQHGDGQMFERDTTRAFDSPSHGVSWLLDDESAERATRIHLVREASETGGFAVLKQYGDWRTKLFATPIHVSDEVGAGGERSRAALVVALELLYRRYTRLGELPNLVIKSYILARDDYRALLACNEHPLALLALSRGERPWWEDIWDAKEFNQQGYWPSWSELCHRIESFIEKQPMLKEERDLVRSGQHPMLARTT